MRMPSPLPLSSAVAAILLLAASAAAAAPPAPDLSEGAINAATFADWRARQDAGAGAPAPADAETGSEPADAPPDPFVIRLQVLLDRAHASPGVVDGHPGGNTDKAVRAFEEMRDLGGSGAIDEALWQAISADAAPAVKTYELTQEDVDGRYVPDLPTDYGELAKLDWLGFRGPEEMLAERFHMDEDLLRALNPGADFETAGTTILVADPGPEPEGKVERIVVDKSKGELIAYGEDDGIVLISPATIGSQDTPSPSGTMKVNGSAPEPTYEYDPKRNFQQGGNDKELTIPPGPNGPVGSMWIDLSKPTYGIHGTPEPSQIDKTASHGCVRLTNWDAEALARLVKPAETVVEFKG
jgi:lipoprotein-anchoring transpeptidase ErfK/SrfK